MYYLEQGSANFSRVPATLKTYMLRSGRSLIFLDFTVNNFKSESFLEEEIFTFLILNSEQNKHHEMYPNVV